ncbi:MAG: CDP-Glycerol:Poly(Glycerophosphate) glycerophosphotransferase [Naasia sp.]|jgi:hypothetical protein|uniref:CDP-glycerol glycerophosphotransferase family protein n=1 Tax=Naasia sp. TaxID=2546198 RepID=UPI002616E778|nr:CDP-glycerol glycerophosphotransferase family protein [Naasia sp.]MCU1570916.1 CDP-Glycerol:Poly(Glycerophosphate) glycerophosphotransferase [Naasia sp.]
MIRRLLGCAALGVSYGGLVTAGVMGEPLVFVLFVALVAVLEPWIASRTWLVVPSFIDVQLGPDYRLLTVDLLTALLAMRVLEAGSTTTLVTVTLMLLIALRGVTNLLARRRAEADVRPIGWANIPGIEDSPERRRPDPATVAFYFLPVSAAIPVGLAITSARGTPAPVLITSALALVAGAVILVLEWHAGRGRSAPPPDAVRAEVRAAVQRMAPEVALYFGGPRSSTHVIEVWLPILATLERPTVVMVREGWHLPAARRAGLPVLHLNKNTDVELFAVDSLKLALYPTNIAVNNHLIRIPGIFDVFVGHGDSDKGGSATPISRIYDEVWVAGPAARDRYLKAHVGVRDEQIREIGRPQLAEIRRAVSSEVQSVPPEGVFTVLYAPTWEGFYAAWSYSSVKLMGERIVSTLLQLPRVRVLYKPHPATGSKDPAFSEADRRIRALLADAGAPNLVVEDLTGLYAAFNEADLLISDISSVVTDFLYSRKPYIVSNPSGESIDAFRVEYPSTGGASILPPDCAGLEEFVEDARGADINRARRAEVAAYLLGESEFDPVTRFHHAVDEALRLQRARGVTGHQDGEVRGSASVGTAV